MKKIITVILISISLFTSCKKFLNGQEYVILLPNDIEPFCYLSNNQLNGILVETFDEIAKDQNFNYKFKHLSFSEIVNNLEHISFDGIISTNGLNPPITYNLALNLYDAHTIMAVKGDNSSIIDHIGLTTAVLKGTNSEYVVKEMQKKGILSVKSYESENELFNAVLGGAVDACFYDENSVKYRIEKGENFKIINTNGDYGKLDFLFSLDSRVGINLFNRVNDGFANIKKMGNIAQS